MEPTKQIVFIICSIYFTDYAQATFLGGCQRCAAAAPAPAHAAPAPPPPPPPRPYYYAPAAPVYVATAPPVPNIQYVARPVPVQAAYGPPPPNYYGQPQQVAYAPPQPSYVPQQPAALPVAPVAPQTVPNLPAPIPAPAPAPPPAPAPLPAAPAYQQQQAVAPAENLDTAYSEQSPRENELQKISHDPAQQADKDLIEVYKKIKLIRKQKNNVEYAASRNNSTTLDDPKCNDAYMREAIIENIDPNPATAKRQIQAAVREKIDGNIDTICSTGSFSYLVNTDLYCEVETADITCLVFRQAT